jgi:serine/threonine-protein kinase RsbW
MDRWSISLPGLPSMVPVARLFVRAYLAGNPLAGDAELITSEYASNAIRYSSASEGGTIQVAVGTAPGLVRIEVTDHPPRPGPSQTPFGPATRPEPGRSRADEQDEVDDSGRGLLIVDALAERWGHDGVVGGWRTAWAEIHAQPEAARPE